MSRVAGTLVVSAVNSKAMFIQVSIIFINYNGLSDTFAFIL